MLSFDCHVFYCSLPFDHAHPLLPCPEFHPFSSGRQGGNRSRGGDRIHNNTRGSRGETYLVLARVYFHHTAATGNAGCEIQSLISLHISVASNYFIAYMNKIFTLQLMSCKLCKAVENVESPADLQ